MQHLVESANNFIFNALAPSTRMTHQAAINSYLDAFDTFGETAPVPATQTSLILWLTHSATRTIRPLAPSTLRTYLSSLTSVHQELGFYNLMEDKPLVNRCFKGIKRFKGDSSKLLRRPITTDILVKVKSILSDNFHCKLYFAAATLATYGLLRMGEFTVQANHLSSGGGMKVNAFKVLTLQQIKLFRADSTVVNLHHTNQYDSVSYMSITLRISKTDPFRKTVTIHVGNQVPVQAMLRYLKVHPLLQSTSAPLFVQSQLVHLPLTRDIMIEVTRKLLKLLGYDDTQFHGHSFRKGGATSLAKAGVSDSVIQLVGRWASECYKLYIVTPMETLLEASRSM